MEISSDNQEQFQQLVMDQEEDIKNKDNKYFEIKQSAIRLQPKIVNENLFAVQIIQNKLDLNLVENQYYEIKLLNKGKPLKQNIIRRFSDFDFLFQTLFKNNLGYIFPAFPEKGILSYVKTKVSVTKDQIYARNRIKMIQRFFKFILNDEKFNHTKCTQIRKFFSNQQFEMFKKIQKQKSGGLISTSWNKLKSYLPFSRENKYQPIADEIKNEKKRFQILYIKVKEVLNLLIGEINANEKVCELNYQFKNFKHFKTLISSYQKDLKELLSRMQQLEFEVFCQNQDFMMVFKTIQALQQERNSDQNYKNISAKQNQFNRQRDNLRQKKQIQYRKLEKKLKQIIAQISKVQQEII